MSETQNTSAKRISVIPPALFSEQYKISKESPHDSKPLNIKDWRQATRILEELHPMTILPPAIRQILKGQTIVHLKNNPGISKKELRQFIWELAAPLLQEMGLQVKITEESAREGQFHVTDIDLIAANTNLRVAEIIEPESTRPDSQRGFAFFDEEQTNPGTPTAKRISERPIIKR